MGRKATAFLIASVALAATFALAGCASSGAVKVSLPILRARAMSGGPVQREVYERFKTQLLRGLQASRLDGVYLALHGAMGVEGMRDPEGDLLAAIREALGYTIPIGVSHDLHANVTRARAALATFIVGYKTNPHRDFFRTGYDCGKILAGTVLGEIRPVMVVRKMRLLKGGGMNIDLLYPMDRIFRFMARAEKRQGVLSVSTFPVHIWLDDEELGWSAVAVTDANAELAAKTADEIADVAWSIRAVPHPRSYSAQELVSCVPLRDAEAALSAWSRQIGESVTLTVGGKLETRYNRPLEFTGKLLRKTEGELGKTVVLRDRGAHLIVSELAPSATQPRFFTDLGLGVWRADIVVVKNLFPFRYSFLAVNRGTLDVETPGTSSVNVFELGYKKIPRPIYPLDPVESWR